MKHRIFIAVNLPKDVSQALVNEQKKISRSLPVRLASPCNFHITLIFLGHIQEKQISEACRAAEAAAGRHSAFATALNKIDYGPPGIMPPRMVWAFGENNRELAEINNELETGLSSKGEGGNFIPHITLARIREWQWRRIEPEERPNVQKDISLKFEVKSIDVMESRLKRTGAEYSILKSFPLK